MEFLTETSTSEFDQFFRGLSEDNLQPHDWQRDLAEAPECENRLIRIPTGFGKTLGVLATWLWHRQCQRNENWPRRLVWCLPMRVLVEQTESEVRSALERLGLFWDEKGGTQAREGKVGVHLLMGGADAGQWHLYPECDAVLIGTQDMLLSRALNRGYACPRARWPMEFGLLNQDALWVMDEVQLMDVGLATSGQLQVFRDDDRRNAKSLRPCRTWWMSATLQRAWLETSPDATKLTQELEQNAYQIEPGGRTGHLWDDVAKPLEVIEPTNAKALAQEVSERHRNRSNDTNEPTLVVLNTVERAIEVWNVLKKSPDDVDIHLVHSRFRPIERRVWREQFLNRRACRDGKNRIIVSTQVVEAGVDISASLLITELAPWPSLVQRFGRCARWGGEGQVVVVDFKFDNEGKAAPYALIQLSAARGACNALQDVNPAHLERFEEDRQELLPGLYPYEPAHLLLRREVNELFDTSSDLSGADIDISRFIRSGDERDVQVFWAEIDNATPPPDLKPMRDEICSVPFARAREWLCGKSERLKPGTRAWVWDWLDRNWRLAQGHDFYPGQTVLVASDVGGYRIETGWDHTASEPVEPVQVDDTFEYVERPCWVRDDDGWCPSTKKVRTLPPEDYADAAEDDETLSVIEGGWQTIASHGLQVGGEVEHIAAKVAPTHAKLLHLAGRWHDLGKAHPAFQNSIQAEDRPERDDIAKAPDLAWPCSPNNMYRVDAGDQRRGFRHELASALGLFGVLQRHDPWHPALLGPWRDLLEKLQEGTDMNGGTDVAQTSEATVIEQEIIDLDSDDFDLLAYLVCSHHGKVRMAWHSSPADQQANDPGLRIRGVREGDILPTLPLAAADGGVHSLPATSLDLSPSALGISHRTGRSWTERALNLVERFGPFTLAWLETLLRAADQRASIHPVTDTLLDEQEQGTSNARQRLEGSDQSLAASDSGGAAATSPRSDSSQGRPIHGDGGRTGGRGTGSGDTRQTYAGTRYIETSIGILSYHELAPLLVEHVSHTEVAILNRLLANLSIHDLLLEIHRRICADLIPDIADHWRLRDVRIGVHEAPPHWQVPVLMRNYAADLEARLRNLDDVGSEQLIDDLTFAEGHLLHIHPFEDFNGRVSRLFLIELLHRLSLPLIDPTASPGEETDRYFAALRSYDQRDPRPLADIWRHRLSQG